MTKQNISWLASSSSGIFSGSVIAYCVVLISRLGSQHGTHIPLDIIIFIYICLAVAGALATLGVVLAGAISKTHWLILILNFIALGLWLVLHLGEFVISYEAMMNHMG